MNVCVLFWLITFLSNILLGLTMLLNISINNIGNILRNIQFINNKWTILTFILFGKIFFLLF